MADNWIVLIPADPRAVPDRDRLQRALMRIKEFAPEAVEAKVNISQLPQFFDCGANFERIVCRSCGRDVPVEWFQMTMDADFDGAGFLLAEYQTPCCDSSQTLDDLRFVWPQGFATCSLELMNPNIESLSDEQRREIESLLGLPLRVIYQHV